MKKLFSMFLLGALLCSFGNLTVFAVDEDNQIIDMLEQIEASMNKKNLKTLNEQLSFKQFSSCEDMTNVLEDFVKENFKDGRGYRGVPVPLGAEVMMEDMISAPMQKSVATNTLAGAEADFAEVKSSSTDFSTTNIQVDGVDEADILKTDGDYLYYFNQRKHQIFVLQSPLDRGTSMIDLDHAKIIKKINLPKNFSAAQMYIHDDTLIILARRWTDTRKPGFLDRGARTDVIVYDVKDPAKPKLLKLSDLDGNYHDSRKIGNKLYVVSQLSINRWHFPQIYKNVDDVVLESKDILPKVIDIAYTKDTEKKNLKFSGKAYPYHIGVKRASCNQIHYVMPDKKSIEQFGIYPSFTLIRTFDLNDTTKEPETTIAFGDTQTIYMSLDVLYLTDPIYTDYAFACPMDARCILPWFESGQHTLIHKFALDTQVKYKESSLVNGSPLNQYSMSEDDHGYFRILTTNRDNQVHTNLYILDDDLDLKGMLMNIEPGEEFKSSRYIGDKLYLVTFERTDPLFVIDLTNTKKPKILGQLVIPGFSTYLHPYAKMQDGVQYLIGLGQATKENQRGGTVTAGIKLDLYKIDYNKKDDKGDISIEQLYTKTWGDKNSTTEALYNPRMFVWDGKRKMVVLPMILAESKTTKNCNIVYGEDGEEIAKNCYENERPNTIFAGLKAIKVDKSTGIKEMYSYNYLDQLKNDKEIYRDRWDGTIYPRQFTQLNRRVGYLGDVLYTLNNLFGDFRVMGGDEHKMVEFE